MKHLLLLVVPLALAGCAGMVEMKGGVCKWDITTHSTTQDDGTIQTDIRKTGRWVTSEETIRIPRQAVPAYLEMMRCESDD